MCWHHFYVHRGVRSRRHLSSCLEAGIPRVATSSPRTPTGKRTNWIRYFCKGRCTRWKLFHQKEWCGLCFSPTNPQARLLSRIKVLCCRQDDVDARLSNRQNQTANCIARIRACCYSKVSTRRCTKVRHRCTYQRTGALTNAPEYQPHPPTRAGVYNQCAGAPAAPTNARRCTNQRAGVRATPTNTPVHQPTRRCTSHTHQRAHHSCAGRVIVN